MQQTDQDKDALIEQLFEKIEELTTEVAHLKDLLSPKLQPEDEPDVEDGQS